MVITTVAKTTTNVWTLSYVLSILVIAVFSEWRMAIFFLFLPLVATPLEVAAVWLKAPFPRAGRRGYVTEKEEARDQPGAWRRKVVEERRRTNRRSRRRSEEIRYKRIPPSNKRPRWIGQSARRARTNDIGDMLSRVQRFIVGAETVNEDRADR